MLCLVFIENDLLELGRSRQRCEQTDAMFKAESVSPDTLTFAAKLFESSIKVEQPNFPITNLKQSAAWSELQDRLRADTEQIKLAENHFQKESDYFNARKYVMSFMLLVAAGLYAAAISRQRSASLPRVPDSQIPANA